LLDRLFKLGYPQIISDLRIEYESFTRVIKKARVLLWLARDLGKKFGVNLLQEVKVMNYDLDKNCYEAEELQEEQELIERRLALIKAYQLENSWEPIVDDEGEVTPYVDYAERHR